MTKTKLKSSKKIQSCSNKDIKNKSINKQNKNDTNKPKKVVTPTLYVFNDTEYLDQLDDEFLLNTITQKYPNFLNKLPDNLLRKEILNFVNDTDFISKVLKLHDITIIDIFKLFCKKYYSAFSAHFIKKLQSNSNFQKWIRDK